MHSGMKIFTCEAVGAPPQINLQSVEALHILGPQRLSAKEKSPRATPVTESRDPQALQGT